MKSIRFFVIDSFTDTAYQGNPAGVFFDDDAILSADEMQRMAGEVSLESAFVTPTAPDNDADFRLRYFTGAMEIPFCGHDTVAVALALVHTGRLDPQVREEIRFQTNVGVVGVRIHPGGGATLLQNLPTFGSPAEIPMTARVASALGCTVAAIAFTRLPVQVVSTGTPWLIVPVNDRAVVDAAPANFDAITALSRETETFGIYVFAIDTAAEPGNADVAVWSRCFAPIAGLNEDPVTGSASGALGGYLAQYGVLDVTPGGTGSIVARQGFGGKRGGTATVVVARDGAGAIGGIAVSGGAVLVAEGSFQR